MKIERRRQPLLLPLIKGKINLIGNTHKGSCSKRKILAICVSIHMFGFTFCIYFLNSTLKDMREFQSPKFHFKKERKKKICP